MASALEVELCELDYQKKKGRRCGPVAFSEPMILAASSARYSGDWMPQELQNVTDLTTQGCIGIKVEMLTIYVFQRLFGGQYQRLEDVCHLYHADRAFGRLPYTLVAIVRRGKDYYVYSVDQTKALQPVAVSSASTIAEMLKAVECSTTVPTAMPVQI